MAQPQSVALRRKPCRCRRCRQGYCRPQDPGNLGGPFAGGSGRKHGRALQRRRRVRRPPPDGGPGREGRLPRPAALAHLWRAPRPGEPRRPGARRTRHRARASRRDADARHGRFPGRVLGRDPGRDHPGAAEHASGARPIRLCARGFPRPARRRLGAAAAGRRSRDRRLRAPRESRRRGSGAGHEAPAARRSPDGGCTGRRAGRDLRRRGRLLALLLGLDRHAEGRQARPFEPDRDRPALRRGRARHRRGRRRLLGREALLRLRPRQRHDLPDGGRRHRRAP